MKNNSRKQKQQQKPATNINDVPLFPRKVRIAIICAFAAVLLAIVATAAYTINMIFNPTIPKDTQQSK